MTVRQAGDFILAADLAGLGTFVQIGAMAVPAPAFAAALRDLRLGQADPEFYDILTHAAAGAAAGLCFIESSGIECALQACQDARLVSEWRITFPSIGQLEALFLVARFQPAADAAGLFDLALQLSGKPVFRLSEP
jgi:hypothetical protein